MTPLYARQSLCRRQSELVESLTTLEQSLQGKAGVDEEYNELERLAASMAKELVHVKHVLQKLGGRSYGTCVNCGKPIGQQRLRAFPAAESCLHCASRAH